MSNNICEDCHGTGLVDCPVCAGSGEAVVTDWTGDPQTEREVPCSECNATGEVPCRNCEAGEKKGGF